MGPKQFVATIFYCYQLHAGYQREVQENNSFEDLIFYGNLHTVHLNFCVSLSSPPVSQLCRDYPPRYVPPGPTPT